MSRLDQEMLIRGLVNTRSQARMLIKQGDVQVNAKTITKPGAITSADDNISIQADQLYVSRGAFKLKAAIENFKLSFAGLVVADCGASTGGFTEILLEGHAKKIYAIDVGRDQLAPLLKANPKVINREGENLKHPLELPEQVDACVADLSFISLKLVIPTLKKLLKEQGFMVVLLKPQFEAGKSRIGKNGIVDEKHHEDIRQELFNFFKEQNLELREWCESPIQGKKGNTEYLVWLDYNANS